MAGLLLLAFATVIGVRYGTRAVMNDFNNAAEATAPMPDFALTGRPSPEQIADAFLNKAVPEDAIRRGYNDVSWSAAEKDTIRKLIIQYESLPISAEDALTYYSDGLTKEEKEFLAGRIAYHKTVIPDPLVAAVRAVQDTYVHIQMFQGSDRPMILPAEKIENGIRNRKYVERYGQISRSQALALIRYAEERLPADEKIQEVRDYKTELDYMTDTPEAWAKGLRSYWTSRYYTISVARRMNAEQKPSFIQRLGIG